MCLCTLGEFAWLRLCINVFFSLIIASQSEISFVILTIIQKRISNRFCLTGKNLQTAVFSGIKLLESVSLFFSHRTSLFSSNLPIPQPLVSTALSGRRFLSVLSNSTWVVISFEITRYKTKFFSRLFYLFKKNEIFVNSCFLSVTFWSIIILFNVTLTLIQLVRFCFSSNLQHWQ